MMKRTLIIGILVVGVAACVFVLNEYRMAYSQGRTPAQPGGTAPANTAPAGTGPGGTMFYNEYVDKRIADQLEPLRKQTLEESLTMLDRFGPYMSGGGIRTIVLVGDPVGINHWYSGEQNVVLASRVFRKCLQEIKSLAPQESASFINRHLESALTAYIEACAAERSITIVGEDKDGNPSFFGIRYKMYALMLIAGTCELTDCHATVKKVAQVAWEQKEWHEEVGRIFDEFGRDEADIARESATQPYLRSPYNSPFLVSLMNPHALSAGLLGTHPRKNSAEFKEIAGRYLEHKIVDYSAPRTEYEDSLGSMVIPGKDYLTIRYFEKATDEDVGTLLGVSDQ